MPLANILLTLKLSLPWLKLQWSIPEAFPLTYSQAPWLLSDSTSAMLQLPNWMPLNDFILFFSFSSEQKISMQPHSWEVLNWLCLVFCNIANKPFKFAR